jgi:PAS domain S-box-containing protein
MPDATGEAPAPPPPADSSWSGTNASDLRSWLDVFPAGAYACDADGLITCFNQRAVELWGRAPKLNDPEDRFCGSFKLFSADGEPISHSECWMALALRERRDFHGQEIIVERPDGSRRTALAHAHPVYDETGRFLGAMNVLVDITERKRAEQAQAFLAAIVESSEDAIISKSLTGQILSWNAGAARLFGYTAEETIGRHITMLMPPERQHEERHILYRLGRGERIEHFETVRVTKDGRRIDISLCISPVRDTSGRIVAASKIARDITARKQAEELLRRNEADLRRVRAMSVRLSTTLELQPILDETLRTAAAIAGAEFGLLSLADQEESTLRIGASVGFSDSALGLLDRVPIGSAACGVSFLERRRVIVVDVETDPLFAPYRDMARAAGFRSVHSTPLVTRYGKPAGVLSMHFRQPHRPSDREMHLLDLCARQAVDFIENARLYEELRAADRRKDEFLAMLAHELRNPLAPLRNSLQILRMSEDLGPAVERVRDVMQRQVDHMVRLVDDLLEVSRISRGKIELRKELTDLTAVVRNAIETSRPLIDGAGHQLAIAISPEPMMLHADPVRIAQVIANLLNNAAKYTENGGQIWISARREGDEAVVSVRDTGAGIPAEMLPRVFEMFTQINRTLNRSQGGLGIGLALARNLVELHGGRIEAHSEGAGMGSEFIVRLPVAAEACQVSALAGSGAGESAVPPSAARRILIVDDLRDAAHTLAKLLQSMGNQVNIAQNAAEALLKAKVDRPHVVISDIGMPEVDGYELAKRIRQEPELKEVVLVALTGYGQQGDRRRTKDAGFDYHLVKPVDLESLEELLASLPPPTGPLALIGGG